MIKELPSTGDHVAIDAPRCVVVDDNDDFACSLSDLVTSFGYDVRVAFSGEHAEHVIRLHQPHCVLLDLALPDLTGSKLASSLRSLHGADIVLVAITGRQDLDVTRSPELACFDHCLQKPIELSRLQAILSH